QRGNRDAIRWRREIASEMSAEEIAAAQRAARLEVTDPEGLARQLIVVADDVEAVAAEDPPHRTGEVNYRYAVKGRLGLMSIRDDSGNMLSLLHEAPESMVTTQSAHRPIEGPGPWAS